MTVLRHSPSGFIRAMQLSATQLFVFVEGQCNDPYVYTKICEAVCRPKGVAYEYRIARELPGGTGGKNALIQFCKHLRRKKLLVNDFKGKQTAVIFFLDKDIDDILRTQIKSPHVVYTQYYDIENHLFASGDLAEAAAAAASFDKGQIARAIGDYGQWRARTAAAWKDWIKLCVFSKKRNVPGEYNYRVSSRINNPLNGPTDPHALTVRMAQLQTATGLPTNKFKRAFERVSKLVDALFIRGDHDRIFKGKWYAALLSEEIKSVAMGRPYNSHNLADRLLTGLALTVSFNDPWTEHFKRYVADVVDLL
jgi:hypothetical protein